MMKMRHDENVKELHYWRKHPNLHGWFEKLYYYKGGEAEIFNCVYIEVSLKDLEDLEYDIRNHILSETMGFFFGKDEEHISDELNEDDLDDLEFIEKAREEIENNLLENKIIEIIDCYDIEDCKYGIKDILDKHDKILNTSGEKNKEEYITTIKVAN